MRVEDLLARQRALHRPAGDHRQLAHDDLVGEGVCLAAEAAAVRGADDADPVHRQLEHLGERAVHVMHDLRRRPQCDLAVDVCRDGAVLFHRQVRVALEEEHVLSYMCSFREATVHVAELQGHELVDVVRPAVVLDALVLGSFQRLLDRHHRLEHLVLDGDRVACRRGGLLVDGGDGGDRIADVTHLLVLERALVLRHREDAELHRQVSASDHRADARDAAGRRGVDGDDAGVRVRAAEDAAVQRARKHHVVGVDRLAGDLRRSIDLRKRFADDPHDIRSAASSTACRIFT